VTVGPRYIAGGSGHGLGGHITYRYVKLYSRGWGAFSNRKHLWHLDLQVNYANMNLLAGGGQGFGGGFDQEHVFGAKVTYNFVLDWVSIGGSFAYLQDHFTLTLLVGVTLWNYNRR